MGSTNFGNFDKFCRDSTLPVCNVFTTSYDQSGPWGGCELQGIPLGNGRHLGNLGSILLCGIAMAVTVRLLLRTERKKAAVGRREMQLFLIGYFVISFGEIFSVGEFPLSDSARIVFSAIHIGAITATAWTLMLNAIVGYQILDDGTFLSISLVAVSALILFLGTGYIVLDTGFRWTGYWNNSYDTHNRNIALYVLYQLVPLICIVAFYVLEAILVLRILNEMRPMVFLTLAALFFAFGQIFNYAISPHICKGTDGRIDGALFQTFFTLIAIVTVWYFWSTITEDDWPPMTGQPPATYA